MSFSICIKSRPRMGDSPLWIRSYLLLELQSNPLNSSIRYEIQEKRHNPFAPEKTLPFHTMSMLQYFSFELQSFFLFNHFVAVWHCCHSKPSIHPFFGAASHTLRVGWVLVFIPARHIIRAMWITKQHSPQQLFQQPILSSQCATHT